MEKLKFTVDSALLSEIGEKLVESVHIALVELVKNSYDADADNVNIKFIKSKRGGPTIIIEDNGVGMTYEDVQRYWMRIATTNKVQNNFSRKYGRPKAGAKGLGRFSCRRLGTKLRLETTALIGTLYETTVVNFPWSDFEAGTEVTEIECIGEVTRSKNGRTGTTLTISGSKDNEWKRIGYNYVKRHLAQLVVNRGQKKKGYTPDPGFNILIDAEGESLETEDLRQDIFDAGWATLIGEVNSKGSVTYILDAKKIGTKTIKGDIKFPELSGITFRLGIIPSTNKDQWRNAKLLAKSELKDTLAEWGGVQVRYNGFRVHPYGDIDWLDIDKDRALSKGAATGQMAAFAKKLKLVAPNRALHSMLSMRSYIGDVEIPGNLNGFEPKASREGFLHNKSFAALKQFVRAGIDWSTIYRTYYLQNSVREKAAKAQEEFKILSGSSEINQEMAVETALEYVQSELENITHALPAGDKAHLKGVIKNFDAAREVIISNENQHKEELRHLRLIASTSTLLLIFSHEVKSLLGTLDATNGILTGIRKKLRGDDAKILGQVVEDLESSKNRFADLIDMTSLIGVESKGAPTKKLSLRNHLESAVKCFNLVIEKYEISIDYSKVPDSALVGPMQEAELYSVLLNIISNSIKSVLAGSQNTKEISFEWKKDADQKILLIHDTGLGLKEKYYEEVFLPFISDPERNLYRKLKNQMNPEDNFIIGSGSGLGLSIIKEILLARDCVVNFQRPQGKWKATLQIGFK